MPDCGAKQPVSGSWAVEEMSQIENLEKEKRYKEAATMALELLHIASDIQYGDWPLAHKLRELIERICSEHGLTNEREMLEEHWRALEAYETGTSITHERGS